MQYKIKTNSGEGSPGYTDAHAPNGGQWTSGPVHLKVPEGTLVEKTGEENTYVPPFVEIRQLDGLYAGVVVWVKSTHLVAVDPVPPTPPEPPVGKGWVIDIHMVIKPSDDPA